MIVWLLAINLNTISLSFSKQMWAVFFSVSHRREQKMCHLNIKYCSCAITWIFIDVRCTSKPNTHIRFSLSCPFVFVASNRMCYFYKSIAETYIKSLPIAVDSVFFSILCFFTFLSICFPPLLFFFSRHYYFVLHFFHHFMFYDFI